MSIVSTGVGEGQNVFFAIYVTRPGIAYLLMGLATIVIVLMLIATRRKFKLYRRLWRCDWYRATYLGETTLFPTYRGRNCAVWIDALEHGRDCYRDKDRYPSHRSNRSRLRRAEEAIREQQAANMLKPQPAELLLTEDVEQPEEALGPAHLRAVN